MTMKQTSTAPIPTAISVYKESFVLCVPPVAIVVGRGMDKNEVTCATEEDDTADVMASITSISVVLGLRVTCTASLADRLAVSVNPSVSSVSLTSESKLNPGQCVRMCWEKSNSTERVSLPSVQ